MKDEEEIFHIIIMVVAVLFTVLLIAPILHHGLFWFFNFISQKHVTL